MTGGLFSYQGTPTIGIWIVGYLATKKPHLISISPLSRIDASDLINISPLPRIAASDLVNISLLPRIAAYLVNISPLSRIAADEGRFKNNNEVIINTETRSVEVRQKKNFFLQKKAGLLLERIIFTTSRQRIESLPQTLIF